MPSAAPAAMRIESFYDAETGSVMHLAVAADSAEAVVIDPILGVDASTGTPDPRLLQALIARCHAEHLTCHWILETHAHADHVSGAGYLAARLHAPVAIGAAIRRVQDHFACACARYAGCAPTRFDRLLRDGERLQAGALSIEVMALPGHTPAGLGYRIDDCVFVGDTLFMPDVGTARCDFPGGSAKELYQSIQRLYRLPQTTRLYLCHDYPPAGRGPCWHVSVAEERRANLHVRADTGEDAFVTVREARDRTLVLPRLIDIALGANLFGLPPYHA